MKKLREGFTTGACAAAAAKLAVMNLSTDKLIFTADVWFPDNIYFQFNAFNIAKQNDTVSVLVKKFAGDDPDITNGALIGAKVKRIDKSGIVIKGGKGVGKVTKKGLAIPPGEPAINPIPLLMISTNINQVDPNPKYEVEIFVIDGEKLAEKTLNNKLGIVGGISILGTTGIVKPVSVEAYLATIELELNVAREYNIDEIVFTTGRTTEKIAKSFLNFDNEAYVTVADNIGFSLKKAADYGFKKIHLVGQFGKFTKIASGEFQTHVKNSNIFISNLINFLNQDERDDDFINLIKESISARDVFEMALNKNFLGLLKNVTDRVARNCSDFISGRVSIHAYLVGYNSTLYSESEI